MTDEKINLRAPWRRPPDADLLREMIGFAAQQLMELEVESLTGAGYSEKSAELLAQRDGYRDRDWDTRAGTIEVRIPTLRRILLPGLFGAATDGREGAHHCCAGGLRARRLHPLGR